MDITLPTNTTDRLLVLADLTENQPSLYDQSQWVGADGMDFYALGAPGPAAMIGKRAHVCDTAGCIAGNAVMLTPPDQYDGLVGLNWTQAGTLVLGLESDLRAYLFDGDLEMVGADIATVLRAIASLPEGERTMNHLQGVLDPVLLDELMQDIGDEYEDD